MGKNRTKEKNMAKPIENHETAAWDNIEQTTPVARVPIPKKMGVENAKDWVDINEK